jgi:hypothetical protein
MTPLQPLCPSCLWQDGCPLMEANTPVYNCWNYEEREEACNTDCPRYAQGTCPYPRTRKGECDRYHRIHTTQK